MKISNSSGGDFPVLDEDAYLGRIYSIVDIGMQETLYGNKGQLIITWEIPSELSEGLPYAISKFYTASLNEKANFCKDIEAMTSKIPAEAKENFDPSKLLGITAQLSISKGQNKEGYDRNKIEQVSKVMKGVEVGKPVNSCVYFDLENPNWPEVFKTLPEWQQKLVNRESGCKTAATTEEDDIPFSGDEGGMW